MWFYIYVHTHTESLQSLSHVYLFATPWAAACQASLSITNSGSLLKLMSIELVMPSNHLILCRPIFLHPSVFPSIRIFPNESVLHIRWLKYWSFSFSISPFNEYTGLIAFRMDWLDLLAVQTWDSQESSPIPQFKRIRVFSNESTLHMRWPKYWSFSFSIIPSKEIPGLISFRMDWLDLLAV